MTREFDRGRRVSPPSSRSVDRLAAGLEAELGDLRRDVDDELRLVEVLRDAGEARAARLLLEIPVGRMRDLDGRLGEVVAAAAVEREAERTIHAASRPPRRDHEEPSRLAPVLAAIVAFAAIALGVAPDATPSAAHVASATDHAPVATPTVGPLEWWPLSLRADAGPALEAGSAAVPDRSSPATRPPAEPKVYEPVERRVAVAETEPSQDADAAPEGPADEVDDGEDPERTLSGSLQEVVEDVLPWGSDDTDVVPGSLGR